MQLSYDYKMARLWLLSAESARCRPTDARFTGEHRLFML